MQEVLLWDDIWCYSARSTNKLIVNVIIIIIIKGKTFSIK